MSERHPSTEDQLIEQLRAIDVRAPEHLHRRVHEQIEHAGRKPSSAAARARGLLGPTRLRAPRRLGPGLAGAAALATGAAVLAFGFSAGSSPDASGSLTLARAAALTLAPATMPAPRAQGAGSDELQAHVEGVAFPAWTDELRWRSTGERADRVAGRAVTTVFYAGDGGRRIGYAIVAGLPAPSVGGTILWRGGTAYHLLSRDGVKVLAWQRSGRLCVASGRDLSGAELLRFAT